VPDYRHSKVNALEINLAFRKYLEDIEYFLHRNKTYFHLLCNYSQTYLLIKIPPDPTKKSQQHISIPNSSGVCHRCIYG